MSQMKYSAKIVLYNNFFDMNDQLSAKSILGFFQGVASIHAQFIGVDYQTMLDKNLYWVLSRVKFDILKKPTINQTVVVETWPHPKGKIDFDRDFLIKDENDEVLIKATSKWCIIDTVNRSLQRTDNVNYLGECCPDVVYPDRFGKIMLPEETLQKQFEHIVRHSDLDHNKHLNNTNYADLVLSATSCQDFSHFEINFVSECLLGDTIEVFVAQQNQQKYVVGKVEDKTVFCTVLY